MGRERRALVVDDDPVVCELIRSVLDSTGLDVLALGTGAEAMAQLRDEKFAVLLFDLRMPAPDGLALTRQARTSGFNLKTPIILLSEDQSTQAFSDGFLAGASFFLYKPIDRKRLLSLARATQGVIEHERRRFRRVPLQSQVELFIGHSQIHCETIDISLDGMLVQAPRSVPAGSSVQVKLHLAPGMKPIVGSGWIMRTLPGNRMGIHLNQLTMTESERLQEFLLPLILKDKPEVSTVRT
jgi:CheY-like chemotaxis protein